MPPKIPDRRSAGSVHDNSLPQWAIDKMARRRGRRYAFENIDPTKTALVVIDLIRAALESTSCFAQKTFRLVQPVKTIFEGTLWLETATARVRKSRRHDGWR
jgi:hypothetical protein